VFGSSDELGLNGGRFSHAGRHLSAWVASREVPAASLLVGRRGRFSVPVFFGHQSERPDAAALRDDAIFLIASITKPIVALAVKKK